MLHSHGEVGPTQNSCCIGPDNQPAIYDLRLRIVGGDSKPRGNCRYGNAKLDTFEIVGLVFRKKLNKKLAFKSKSFLA